MSEFHEVPVIDVGAAGSDGSVAFARLVMEFTAAYRDVGFAYIVNHGIEQATVESVFAASARFHGLPSARKLEIGLNGLHRGFIAIDTSTDRNSKLAEVRKPNQSQSFMMMREAGPDDPDVRAGAFLAGPNQWPRGLPGFREAVTAYSDAMSGLGRRLIRVVAAALGSDAAKLLAGFERPTTWLRLLHYPPQPAASPDDLYGSAPHCDFGCLTLLAQDDVGGLQVQTPGGQWIDVPRLSGAFVVNVGDMLHRWSNGLLRSTPHRVINHSGRERYSVPFFFDPNVAVEIAPLPSCVTAQRPAAFAPVVFGDFLRAELTAGYDRHKASAADGPARRQPPCDAPIQ